MSTPDGPPWRPTAALFRATLLGGLGAFAAVLWHRPDALVLATPMLVVATWSWVRRPHTPLEVRTRLGHQTLREGEATTMRAVLSVPRGVDDVVIQVSPSLFAQLDPPLGIQVVGSREVNADRSASASVVVRSTRWGIRAVAEVQYAAWSEWGAFRQGPVSVDPVLLTTLPLPATFTPSAPLPPPEGLVGPHRSARIGSGSEFDTLRPFQPGDRLRRIHWPVSLRTGVLHVSSTYGDEDALVVIVVDAFSDLGPREGIDGRPTSLDVTVRAAAAIAEHHLAVGDRVGLRVVGSADIPRVPVGTGRPHLRRVLGVLARIRPATERRDDGERAIAGIGAGALVFVLSPLVDPGMVDVVARLGARGLTVVVVDTMPDHLWTGQEDMYASLAWRIRRLSRGEDVARLTGAGVPVVPWKGPGSLDLVLRELSRRSRAPRMARR